MICINVEDEEVEFWTRGILHSILDIRGLRVTEVDPTPHLIDTVEIEDMPRGAISPLRYDLERIEIRVLIIPCAIYPDLDSYRGGGVGRGRVRIDLICQSSRDIL